ncbi:MAG: molybdopterin molybdenumtransferase MoeA [Candidatus Sericytochromatia bacterium]|nr:MAG: molybdopterin molybdenumtransferase MoeA [Candidatus Sericytochromatia bacterium]
MVSVDEAEKIILDSIINTDLVEDISLVNCYNRVLAEDIKADREQPPFDRVAMDGIAIPYKLFEKGLRKFRIQKNIQRAGIPSYTLEDNFDCIEVMTGAKMPNNTDTVIKYEDLIIENNVAYLKGNIKVDYKQNIHFKGSDYSKNQILLQKGVKIGPIQTSIIASIGKSKVKVFKIPNIAIIATGDELVDIDKEPLDYQIRMSNAYAIQCGLVNNNFINSQIFHLNDDKDILLNKMRDILNNFDFLIMSGGVSVGKFDFIPEILKTLEVKEFFHKVKQKPGKPLFFGKSKNNVPIFGLPGNPISTIVCFYRYVIPCLYKICNKKYFQKYVTIYHDFNLKNQLTNFLPVKTFYDDNYNFSASVIKTNGSGDYYSAFESNGFIEIKENTNFVKAGTILKYFEWNI